MSIEQTSNRNLDHMNERRYSKLVQALIFCLAILPACVLGALMLRYSVNLPFHDEWVIASETFGKVAQGDLSFGELMRQHNESRLFFPKLIFIGVAYLTDGNVRYVMLVTFLLACVVSFNIYRLSQLTLGVNRSRRLLLFFVANLLIFAPIQYENWLWGIQLIVFVPIACIATSILVAYSGFSTSTKFLVGMCLSTISTFSNSNGILCWIVVFPVLVLAMSRTETTKKKWFIVGWLGGLTANAALYFYDYQKPSWHPSFWEGLTHPTQALRYFSSFLGAPFGFGTILSSLAVATIVGTVLALLFALCCLYVLKFATDLSLVHRTIGWLMIGVYSIFSALIATFGRVGFGVEQSLAPRYTSFAIYLTVSLVYLFAIILDDSVRKGYFSRSSDVVGRLALSSIVTLVCAHLLTSAYGVQQMSQVRTDRLQGKACVLFINFVKEKQCIESKVFYNTEALETVERGAKNLNSLGFLRPGLVTSSRVREIEGASRAGSNDYGSFESVAREGDEYVAGGWAILPDREEQADSVILAYRKADGDPTAFTIAAAGAERGDVAEALNESAYSHSGWRTSFSASELPPGPIKLEAWAFDANTGKAFKLDGAHPLTSASG
jgi:hypothetical protein